MHSEHPPVGSNNNDKRLPANPDDGVASPLAAGRSPQAQSFDIFDGERREDRDEIDLLAYWRILVKRRWLVLGILATGATAALLLTLFTTPIYRATAVLQIDREVQQVVQVEGMTQVQGGNDYDFYQTQYELLKSRALAERAADELNLADAEALKQLKQMSWWNRVTTMLRPERRSGTAKSGIITTAAQRRQAVAVVQRALEVEPIGNSALVRVHYDSPVPEFSARAANAIADGFIASGIERRFGASSYAKKYLEAQLSLVKSRLEASERQLVAYAQKENIVSNAGGQSLVSQNLGDLNSALAAAQDQRIRAQARWSQTQSAFGAALPADMLANSIIRTLQEQRAELRGQYQEKLQVYKPDYPLMLQINGQLEEIDKQIARELSNIRASVKAEYDAAISQERMLMAQLGSLRSQTLDVDNRSIRYNILKREVDTNRQLYDGLLQRYKEVGVAGQLSGNNISIVDRAQAPRAPYKPSLMTNMALGLLVGLLLGVLVAFVLEFLDDTLKTPDDIEQRLKLAVLGIIPKLGPKQTLAQVRDDPRSGFSESYRSVRTALQFSTDQGVPRILLLTSPGEGEGKSTSALSLARKFTQLGKRVLLVEADLRNPSLRRTMHLQADVGLSSILAGACSTSDATLATDDERLNVILAGPLPPNPAELLSGTRLISLLTSASEQFDLVIIDGPPVLGITDAPILANLADGTLLVVHSGKTRIVAAQAAIKRLVAARAHMIGALLTMYDVKGGGYGYASYHAYGYGHAPPHAKD